MTIIRIGDIYIACAHCMESEAVTLTFAKLGNLYAGSLAEMEKAEACFIEALDLYNRLQPDHPDIARIQGELSVMRVNNDKTQPQSDSAVKSKS